MLVAWDANLKGRLCRLSADEALNERARNEYRARLQTTDEDLE
jgi:hypothetical protein